MTSAPIPAALRGRALVVVDVEGNGRQPPEIIEIALLPVTGPVTVNDLRTWLVRPRQKITPMMTRMVHGITDLDVVDCPVWTDVAADVSALLGERIMVAHNASVDQRALATHLPDWEPPLVLDTLRLAEHIRPGLDSYRLDDLITHYDLDTGPVCGVGRHRAGYDAWAVWQLLCALLSDSGLDWLGLVKIAALSISVQIQLPPQPGLW